MPAPRWLARFNLHVTNRLLGPLARRLRGMGVVVHVGRKTHRRYRTPVLVFRRDDRLIIAQIFIGNVVLRYLMRAHFSLSAVTVFHTRHYVGLKRVSRLAPR